MLTLSHARSLPVNDVAQVFAWRKELDRSTPSEGLALALEQRRQLVLPRLGLWLLEVALDADTADQTRATLAQRHAEIAAELGRPLTLAWLWLKVCGAMLKAVFGIAGRLVPFGRALGAR